VQQQQQRKVSTRRDVEVRSEEVRERTAKEREAILDEIEDVLENVDEVLDEAEETQRDRARDRDRKVLRYWDLQDIIPERELTEDERWELDEIISDVCVCL
jgi:hypothetical protein